MKRKTRFAALFVALSLFTGLAAAQASSEGMDSPEVILVPDIESGLISTPVAEEHDAPVLQVGSDYVPRSTMDAISDMNSQETIIVGADSSVSNDVERSLESRFGESSVTRVGAGNQVETSIQVSQDFWPNGASEVAVVQAPEDSDPVRISRLKNTISGGKPVLISESGSLSSSVTSEVSRLNPDRVVVYGHSPEGVSEDLKQIGVNEIEVRKEDTLTGIGSGIDSDTDSVLVKIAGDTDSINAISSVSGTESVVVDSQSDISELVNSVNRANVKEVVVAGDSSLARSAVASLRIGTDAKIDKEYDSASATVEVSGR